MRENFFFFFSSSMTDFYSRLFTRKCPLFPGDNFIRVITFDKGYIINIHLLFRTGATNIYIRKKKWHKYTRKKKVKTNNIHAKLSGVSYIERNNKFHAVKNIDTICSRSDKLYYPRYIYIYTDLYRGNNSCNKWLIRNNTPTAFNRSSSYK